MSNAMYFLNHLPSWVYAVLLIFGYLCALKLYKHLKGH